MIDQDVLNVANCPKVEASSKEIWSSCQERGVGRRFHGFLALADWLGVYEQLSEEEKSQIVAKTLTLLKSWRDSVDRNSDSMAFHDETTAQRTIYLSAFYALLNSELSQIQLDFVYDVVLDDLERLSSAGFYAGCNNHGMFQNIALIVAGELLLGPSDLKDRLDKLAFERLWEYFSVCFTVEGVHVENSPGYHLMVSRYLKDVLSLSEHYSIASRFKSLQPLLEKADLYAAFCLAPYGGFPPISDTEPIEIRKDRAERSLGSGYLLHSVTLGNEGTAPSQKALVLPKSGYAIHRASFEDVDSSYIFFSAAYNADYHKHSDELSIYVYSNGVELLREAGCYGYDRRDPYTDYAFSSNAHNTMLVDRRGLPRVDQKMADTYMLANAVDAGSFDVEGVTLRYPGVEWHRRVIVGGEGAKEPVRITDTVKSKESHTYTFLWHFGPGLNAVPRGSYVELFDQNRKKVGELTWKSSALIKTVKVCVAQEDPYLQGWIFPRMKERLPAPCLEVEVDGVDSTVDWEFRTCEFKAKERGVGPGVLSNTGWRIFPGDKPVRYLLEIPEGRRPVKLAVVFSAIHEKWNFTCNYRDSLTDFDAAKLYILDDFGDQGCYYLSNHRDLTEFRSVQALIHHIISSHDIPLSACSAIGSAKGGTAALIHGLSAGFGAVYAGAPDYRVGDFLKGPHPNIIEYMSGGSCDADVQWINETFERLIRNSAKCSYVRMVIGKDDVRYKSHVLPLEKFLRNLGVRVKILVVPGGPHSEIGTIFSRYLVSLGKSACREDNAILPYVISGSSQTGEVGIFLDTDEEGQIAFVPFVNGIRVPGRPIYGPLESFSFEAKKGDTVRFRVYYRKDNRKIVFGSRPVKV
ncbi:heparinase II/III family protein [Corynebacterium sp. P5848]|uniref:heparinase II/III domain-containing protein n=1 Tax=Corynebacterium marambiense TaxID=2765364 RepID=UPI002260EFE6|nr:heparinase II/III family protein [Corynebacterium marambiense]MCX7542894.1 heparinase II/III family protein [Corynebacterium marambiense]